MVYEIWIRDVWRGLWVPEGYRFRDLDMALWWCGCAGGEDTRRYQVRERLSNRVVWEGRLLPAGRGTGSYWSRRRARFSTSGGTRWSRVWQTLRKRVPAVVNRRDSGL